MALNLWMTAGQRIVSDDVLAKLPAELQAHIAEREDTFKQVPYMDDRTWADRYPARLLARIIAWTEWSVRVGLKENREKTENKEIMDSTEYLVILEQMELKVPSESRVSPERMVLVFLETMEPLENPEQLVKREKLAFLVLLD